MGRDRACTRYKVVKIKGRRFGARCVEFSDKMTRPVCPSQGIVTFGRSQHAIRGRVCSNGIHPRTSLTSRAMIYGPSVRGSSKRRSAGRKSASRR